MGQRTWAQRDAALRKQAIPLDSCVDEVFRKFGLEPAAPTPTDALFGSDKNKFQPINLTFDHTKRTTFDGGANVRARVRFRMEGKYAVAWLDDLHSLDPHHFRGKGDSRALWQLPGGAPYATTRRCTSTSAASRSGASRTTRSASSSTARARGCPASWAASPRCTPSTPRCPLANATKWDPKAWKLLGPERHHATFKAHVKNLFPMIMAMLLNTSAGLPGMTAEDERVRAWWAKGPAVAVYKE